MIDYALAKHEGPKLKAALTRAKNTSDPDARYAAVRKACKLAVEAWERWGAWPDQWSLWQRTLDDAHFNARRNGKNTYEYTAPRLEEL